MDAVMNGTGCRTIGYAVCPRCDHAIMRRTCAKIVAEAVLVQFSCPDCLDTITCAMSTEDDQPIRLDWIFGGIETWQRPAMSPAERTRRDELFELIRERNNHA